MRCGADASRAWPPSTRKRVCAYDNTGLHRPESKFAAAPGKLALSRELLFPRPGSETVLGPTSRLWRPALPAGGTALFPAERKPALAEEPFVHE